MTAGINRRWRLRGEEPSAGRIAVLARGLGIAELTARVLLLRDIATIEQGRDFLQARLAALPDPDLLPAMAVACGRLEQALVRGERIAVHGDYDVDGISGATLLVETLRQLGGQVEYHIPLRLTEGYGLSAAALRKARENGCDLIVSVDCGVTAVAEAELAAELGIDLIITDHHQPPAVLPRCLALINPHLPDSRFPWAELAGVGVAFFLLVGLRRRLRENGYFSAHAEPDLRQGLDLVALGTIADLVPLGGVNRILVRSGLELLEQGARPGIAALKRVSGVTQVSCGAVGFRLAPRLNAAGRLEDAALGVKLLLGEEPQELEPLAQLLDGFNRERQQLEQQTLEQAVASIEEQGVGGRFGLVLAGEGWHPGVIGIVASRLVERYHRPTVLIALENGAGKGSARSIDGFHLYRALQKTAPLLSGFGGHAMAAGLSLVQRNLDQFIAAFEQLCRAELRAEDLTPVLKHDGEIELSRLDSRQLLELESLSPFGMGNPQPSLVSRRCTVHAPRLVAEKNLKFGVAQGACRLDCIGFGLAERLAELTGEIDLLFRPGLNSWRGQTQIQLQVVDFRPAGESAE
jgi:single-stranded-DNA-specific exonuclease